MVLSNEKVQRLKGTIKNVTIGPSTYVNLTGSAGTDLTLGANFISGSAVSGAQIRIWSSGGSVVSTTFNNARLYMYGGQTEGVLYRGRAKDLIFENKAYFENGGISTAVVSGVTSSYNFSGGTATNLTFRTSAYAHVRNQGYISGAVVSGQSTRIVVSGGGLIEVQWSPSRSSAIRPGIHRLLPRAFHRPGKVLENRPDSV